MPNGLTIFDRLKLAVNAFIDPTNIILSGDHHIQIDGNFTISATGNVSFQSGKFLGYEEGNILLNSEDVDNVVVVSDVDGCIDCGDEAECNCVEIENENPANGPGEEDCGCGGCICGKL